VGLAGAAGALGGDAHLLQGTLSYSGKTRGVFAESEGELINLRMVR
jgi:hypothetical protein